MQRIFIGFNLGFVVRASVFTAATGFALVACSSDDKSNQGTPDGAAGASTGGASSGGSSSTGGTSAPTGGTSGATGGSTTDGSAGDASTTDASDSSTGGASSGGSDGGGTGGTPATGGTTSADAALPDGAIPCTTACDCAAGQDCFQGVCGLNPTFTVYCCTGSTCPNPAVCQNTNGTYSICGSPTPDGGPNFCSVISCNSNQPCQNAGCSGCGVDGHCTP